MMKQSMKRRHLNQTSEFHESNLLTHRDKTFFQSSIHDKTKSLKSTKVLAAKKSLHIDENESFGQSKLDLDCDHFGQQDVPDDQLRQNQSKIQQARTKNTEALYKLYIEELKVRTRNTIIERRTLDQQKQSQRMTSAVMVMNTCDNRRYKPVSEEFPKLKDQDQSSIANDCLKNKSRLHERQTSKIILNSLLEDSQSQNGILKKRTGAQNGGSSLHMATRASHHVQHSSANNQHNTVDQYKHQAKHTTIFDEEQESEEIHDDQLLENEENHCIGMDEYSSNYNLKSFSNVQPNLEINEQQEYDGLHVEPVNSNINDQTVIFNMNNASLSGSKLIDQGINNTNPNVSPSSQFPMEDQDQNSKQNQSRKKKEKPPNQVEWFEIMDKPRPRKLIEEIEKQLKTSSVHFDSINYMSRNQIKCMKLHYSVPTFPSDISALISFNSEKNCITLFNFETVEDDMMKNKNDATNLFRLKSVDMALPIDEIQGFVYGSFLSRFWMLRIGMNQLILDNSKKANQKSKSISNTIEQMEKHRSKVGGDSFTDQNLMYEGSPIDTSRMETDETSYEVPFYAWQCISICMKNGHTINLIIKDELDMKIFLLFLIQKLKSFDGVRDTFDVLYSSNKDIANLPFGHIMQRVYKRYALMKLQMKISFEACRQYKTIQELFLTAILKTYNLRQAHGLITDPYPKITKEQIQNIKYLCLKNLTEKNKMEEETKERARQDLIDKGKKSKLDSTLNITCNKACLHRAKFKKYTEIVGEIKEERDEIFNIVRAVFKSNQFIDEQFMKSNEDKQKVSLVDDYLITKKNRKGEIEYTTQKDAEFNMDANQTLWKLKQTIKFKNKISLQERMSLFYKLNLLIKLRLLEGPLFIHALKEIIELKKQIFVLELEKGIEVAVPRELNMKDWPLSYQFYNCLQEIIRQNVQQQSKYYFFKEYQHKHQSSLCFKPPQKQTTKLSNLKENTKQTKMDKMKLYLHRMSKSVSRMTDTEFDFNQKLYQHSLDAQNGLYAQIHQKQVRIKQMGLNSNNSSINHGTTRPDFYNEEQFSPLEPKKIQVMNNMWYGTIVDLKDFQQVEENMISNPNLQVVTQYLNSKKVASKRKNLLAQKILYQNQLTSLKEKGKRLLLCEKVDKEMRNKKIEYLEFAEKEIFELEQQTQQRRGDQFTDEEKREAIRKLENVVDLFDDQSLNTQEENIQRLRSNLVHSLYKAKTFDGQTKFINNKIEYDQRFFNNNYCEFQKMISDIRKELRLKRDLMKFKKQIMSACKHIDHNTPTRKAGICKSKTMNFISSSGGCESSPLSDEKFMSETRRQELRNQLSMMDEKLRSERNISNSISKRPPNRNEKSKMSMVQDSMQKKRDLMEIPKPNQGTQESSEQQIREQANKIFQRLGIQSKSGDTATPQDSKSAEPNNILQQLSQKLNQMKETDPEQNELDEIAKKVQWRRKHIQNIKKQRQSGMQKLQKDKK